MLERLIHEPLAREIGQPLLTLSSLNKINFNLIFNNHTNIFLLPGFPSRIIFICIFSQQNSYHED